MGNSKLRWTTKKAQVQLSADVLSRKNTSRSHSEAAHKSKQLLESFTQSVKVQSSSGKRTFGDLWRNFPSKGSSLRDTDTRAEIPANSTQTLAYGVQPQPTLRRRTRGRGQSSGVIATKSNAGGRAKPPLPSGEAVPQAVPPASGWLRPAGPLASGEAVPLSKVVPSKAPSVASSDQPIQIRLHTTGLTTKIYTSYQWKEDVKKNISLPSIRTTPGRILLNQIIQKYL